MFARVMAWPNRIDHIANRWIISQFAGTSVPTDECVAVSQTSDATGAIIVRPISTNFSIIPISASDRCLLQEHERL